VNAKKKREDKSVHFAKGDKMKGRFELSLTREEFIFIQRSIKKDLEENDSIEFMQGLKEKFLASAEKEARGRDKEVIG
jgi:hypothetical protein